MIEAAVLVTLGWLFGLLSPRIVDAVERSYRLKSIARAVRAEAEDLRIRLALGSFHVRMRRGTISRKYLIWLRAILSAYCGDESTKGVAYHVDRLLEADEQEFEARKLMMLPKAGTAVVHKKFSASFIDVSLPEFARFPLDYQRALHQFRNQLFILNQDIDADLKRYWLSFDSGIDSHNQKVLRNTSEEAGKALEFRYERVADCLSEIIKHRLAEE